MSEVVASTFLRLSRGFEEASYGAAALFLFACSLVLLAKAMKVVPLSVAYSLWAGLGILGTLIAGSWLFGEAIGKMQLLGAALIVVGAMLVRLSTPDLP